MKLLIAALLVAWQGFAAAQSSSSSSSSSSIYLPTASSDSTVSVPPYVATELSSAAYSYPSVYSMGSVLSTIDLASPTFSDVETEIDSYISSYSSLISYMELIYASPSLDTDPSAFSEETQQFSTLASAISSLVSMESSHPSLDSIQSSLQSLMVTASTILSDLYAYNEAAYPDLYAASDALSEAELTSSSLFGEVVAVSSAVSGYYTVSYALSYLSYSMYTEPYSVYSYVVTMISSPSTVSNSVITYMEENYPSLYSYVNDITVFTYLTPTIVSDLTGFLSAAYSFSSIGSAVYTVISYEMPTLSYDISVLSSVASVWPSATTDMTFLMDLDATSSTLSNAETTIEASFYSDASVAYEIYTALKSPSTCSNPSEISSIEESHISLVEALDEVLSFESEYPQYECTLAYIDSQLDSQVFPRQRTFLTVVNYVSDVTSASTAVASSAISSAESVVSSISTVLSSIDSDITLVPTLSCEEDSIASYALTESSVVFSLWSAVNSPSCIASSSVSYYAQLEDSYSSLFYDLLSVESDISSYPSLSSNQYEFMYAATDDSSLLSQWSTFTSVSLTTTTVTCTVTCK